MSPGLELAQPGPDVVGPPHPRFNWRRSRTRSRWSWSRRLPKDLCQEHVHAFWKHQRTEIVNCTMYTQFTTVLGLSWGRNRISRLSRVRNYSAWRPQRCPKGSGFILKFLKFGPFWNIFRPPVFILWSILNYKINVNHCRCEIFLKDFDTKIDLLDSTARLAGCEIAFSSWKILPYAVFVVPDRREKKSKT